LLAIGWRGALSVGSFNWQILGSNKLPVNSNADLTQNPNGATLPKRQLVETEMGARAQTLGLLDLAQYRAYALDHPEELYELLTELQVLVNRDLVAKAEALQTYQAELKVSIEELQSANIAVLEREEYLKAVIDGASVAILTLDRYGFITSYNNFAAKLFGYEKYEVVGKPILKLLDHQSKKDVSHYLSRIVTQERNSVFKGRVHALAKDNNQVITDFSISPIQGNGKIYFTVIITDVTESVLFSETIRQKNDKLQKVNAELDRFLYMASHDLKTPVGELSELVDKVLGEPNMGQQADFLAGVHRLTQQLCDFVNDVVTYTHQARSSVDLKPIQFKELIEASLQKIQDLDGQTVDLTIKIDHPHTSFVSDPVKLGVVLENIVSNAAKYRKPGQKAKLDVDIEVNDRRAILHLTDHGIGIPEVHLPKIFDMFYRADPTMAVGTGLGLYMVKEAVERIEGSIRVESVAGQGTTFVLGLPNLRAN
jgi:PAS domain S-box-containing protein